MDDTTYSTSMPIDKPIGGGRIAFDSDRDGNREIYVMNADDSEQTNLTSNPSPDWHSSWAPR
jgi:Tol biopolymer transport system component